MPTTQDHFLVREEKIQKLERFADALAEAARRCDSGQGETLKAIHAALSAQCPRCGARLTGEEVLLLSLLPSPKEEAKIQQLRKGHCVRTQCDAVSYKLYFENHPELNWEKLFSQGKAIQSEHTHGTEPVAVAEPPPEPTPARRITIRAAILIGIVLLLLLARQWHNGGRIPFLREPEKFRIDPLPAGQTHE